ncbi:PREDICTED: peptidyl-prolyl cis-trans isomerase FKBP2 isoform X1 [Rhinopithecus bieti]|uniref:peptidyl-prolyl cis-trans isomerase FKBP2 isoform X1 n=1 Tax=Rhinopithecus bieti TaxID=61621 RepID=UPI00083C4CAE|nr:PREDICTED: peptidyl-prolyl cis-trans isomerase FKBP2 isoform X1 [Rhinopithecus bieti]
MCGCLGAGPRQRPQRCWCAGPGAAGCGVSGTARSGQLQCSQIGSGLYAKGQAGTEERRWGPGGREGMGVSKGAGPWLLWPPLTPPPAAGVLGQAPFSLDCRSVGVCAHRNMRLSWVRVLTVLSICLSAVATATGAEGKRKLQIGVKKRVDHCPIKSRKGDVLHMHYTGKLEDGTEFDSSLPQNQPFVFSLGTGQVIKGWDQGLLGMCEGEKRKLVIPSELGYGERGAPPKIPGGATLVFEVELLKIERRSEL